MVLEGQVVRRPFGTGSKSERQAVMIQTDEAAYVLRRQGGLAFGDPELDKLVGKRIRGSGTLTGYTFLMSGYTELSE